jgi:MOSC domain-containing protein YiiM
MRVVSVNVGLPRLVRWNGREVTTGIFKKQVEGRIPLRRMNLEGDRQADLSVHGGAAKAVYAYPLEHYAYWREELGDELPLGAFGENLTVDGLPLEQDIAVGDRFHIGTAALVVTQPRLACSKLALRFGRWDIVKRFLASRRTGYYLAVARGGRRRSRRPGREARPPSGPDPGVGDHPRVRDRSGRPRDDRAARRPRRSTGRLAKLLRQEARRQGASRAKRARSGDQADAVIG